MIQMILAVDTSVLIDVENRKESVIAALSKLSAENPLPTKITFITYFEFLHALAERHPAKKEKTMAFMEMFDKMQPTKKTAEIQSHLRRKYERKGQSLASGRSHDSIAVH